MIEKDIAFVVRRYNFRETSLITTLYTYKFGKIRGIFKGFYTNKREFASGLNIFSLNEFVFYPKKSEIWLISHADLISDYGFLRENLPKARIAALLFNLIDKTMQLWDRNFYVFELIKNCLNLLNNEDELKILYIFLIKFFTFSGFKPEFNHCISCRSILGQENLFSVSRGGLICKNCSFKIKDAKRLSLQAKRSLLYIQREEFPYVSRLIFDLKCEEEIFYILGEFLSYHFDFNELLNMKKVRCLI